MKKRGNADETSVRKPQCAYSNWEDKQKYHNFLCGHIEPTIFQTCHGGRFAPHDVSSYICGRFALAPKMFPTSHGGRSAPNVF